jgi:membrane protein required for colicin V production
VNQIDVLLLILLLPFALRGYMRGFVRESLALAGLLGGAFVAAVGGPTVAAALVSRHLLPPLGARIVAFVGLFLAVYVGAQIVGVVVDRVARAIFLGGLNRAAGLALGIAKGATVLGFALILFERVAASPRVSQMIASSRLGRPLAEFASHVIQLGRRLAPDTGERQPA